MNRSRPPSVQQIIRKAKAHVNNREYEQAEQLYHSILDAYPSNKRAQDGLKALVLSQTMGSLPQRTLDDLVTFYNSGQLIDLITMAEQLTEAHADSATLYNLLGVAKAGSGDLSGSLDAFRRAVDICPGYADALKNLGSALQKAGALDEAEATYKRALQANPDFPEAYNGLGVILYHKNDPEEAVGFFLRCLKLKPDYAEAHHNLGLAHQKIGQLAKAMTNFRRAIELFPTYAEAYNSLGIALYDNSEINEAIEILSQAIKINPNFAQAFNNLGNALKKIGAQEKAIAYFSRALEIDPGYVEAHINFGDALRQQGAIDKALTCYNRANAINPNIPEAHFNLGLTHARNDDPPSAIASFARALELKPVFDRARAEKLQQQAMICDWSAIEQDLMLIPKLGTEGESVPPFAMLPLEDAPERHRVRSEKFIEDECLRSPFPPLPRPTLTPEKLRVGYFSADFHNHATMWLMLGLFALHNQQKFEIFAYSYGPDQNDDIRGRLADTVDQFRDVRDMDDESVAKLAREDGIDIAVDLKGLTGNNRLAIFAYRPVPIQIHYLGYPGTTGAPFIDYLIADDAIIPETECRHYSEKIITMPHSYQVNDDKREISDRIMTREEFHLPANGLVFCCFNNNYKITPTEFDIWMRLLNKTPGSVLWLLKGNPWAAENLLNEAAVREISAERVIFADRVPMAEHLARHRLADLFLDTFKVNAHTTMSDALWAGLPAVTKLGQGFPARVGASLLKAVGMPELITHTAEEYESLIYDLATNPEKLSSLKSKLETNRTTMPLFNTALFTRNLEEAYMQAYQTYIDGHPPKGIQIGA
jgi:protein O-GlcNAc transferase